MKILKAELDNQIFKKLYFSSKLTLITEVDVFQKKVKNNVFKKQNFYKKCKVIDLLTNQYMIYLLNQINLKEDPKEMVAGMEVKGVKDFWEVRIGDSIGVRVKEGTNILMIKIEYLVNLEIEQIIVKIL